MNIARGISTGAFALLLMLTGAVARADTLAVAVAANLQYLFDEIKTEFKQESGHEVQAVFGSSGKLVAQIMHGAPFDVFLSADMAYPEHLSQQGFTSRPAQVYGYGALVLWSRKKNLDLRQWQSLLSGAGVNKIALANPKTSPYGREAMHVLTYYGLQDKVQARLVYGESIAQVNQYIHAGVADLGFTAKSVLSSPAMQGQGSWVELPPASYQAIAQGAVLLKHGAQNKSAPARQFYDFLYSAKVRAILVRHGYLLP